MKYNTKLSYSVLLASNPWNWGSRLPCSDDVYHFNGKKYVDRQV